MAYMDRVDKESAARRAGRLKKRRRGMPAARRANARLLKLQVPATASSGETVTVTLSHAIPESLGEQLIHVTLKDATSQHRIERQVLHTKGTGQLIVLLKLPSSFSGKAVRVAAFVGKDFPNHLQHLMSKPIVVRPAKR